MRSLIPVVLFFFLSTIAIAQTTIPSITGWKMQEHDGHFLFTPVSLIKTGFSYEIMPAEKNTGESLSNWLQQVAQKDLQTSGYTLASAKDMQTVNLASYILVATDVSDASGKRWNIGYTAYHRPDQSIRYAKVITPSGYKSEYTNTAIKHFIDLSKKEGVAKPAGEDAPTATTNSKPTNTTTQKNTGTPVTAPGQGLKPSGIKGVVMNMEYGIGVGGMMIMEYRPYLLLNDGSIYKYIKVSPYDLDVTTSRKTEANKWGTWKLEGKTLVVQLPQKDGTPKTGRWTKNWFFTKPATPGEKINGSFKTIGGGGNTALGGSSMIVIAGNITLTNKGEFAFEKTVGGSNSDYGVSTTTSAKKNSAGTYTIDGYSIELRYNNGQVIRQLFYFYPDDHNFFVMGDDAWVPVK